MRRVPYEMRLIVLLPRWMVRLPRKVCWSILLLILRMSVLGSLRVRLLVERMNNKGRYGRGL